MGTYRVLWFAQTSRDVDEAIGIAATLTIVPRSNRITSPEGSHAKVEFEGLNDNEARETVRRMLAGTVFDSLFLFRSDTGKWTEIPARQTEGV